MRIICHDPFESVFDSLPAFPKVVPQVPFLFDAAWYRLEIKRFRSQGGAEFIGADWSRDRPLRKRANRIGGREWPALRILRDINEDAARRALGHNALVCNQVWRLAVTSLETISPNMRSCSYVYPRSTGT